MTVKIIHSIKSSNPGIKNKKLQSHSQSKTLALIQRHNGADHQQGGGGGND